MQRGLQPCHHDAFQLLTTHPLRSSRPNFRCRFFFAPFRKQACEAAKAGTHLHVSHHMPACFKSSSTSPLHPLLQLPFSLGLLSSDALKRVPPSLTEAQTVGVEGPQRESRPGQLSRAAFVQRCSLRSWRFQRLGAPIVFSLLHLLGSCQAASAAP